MSAHAAIRAVPTANALVRRPVAVTSAGGSYAGLVVPIFGKDHVVAWVIPISCSHARAVA